MEKKNISLMTACSKIGMGGADALAPAGTSSSETTMLNTAGVRHRKFFFLFKKKKKNEGHSIKKSSPPPYFLIGKKKRKKKVIFVYIYHKLHIVMYGKLHGSYFRKYVFGD